MTKIKTSTSIAAGFIGGVAFLVGCGGGSTSSAIAAAADLWSNVGTAIFYTSGNVGIGTNTPTTVLHVKGDSGSTNPFYLQTIETNRTGGDFIQGVRSNGNEAFSINQDGGNNAHMYFRDGADNIAVQIQSSAISYFNGGNVGIGTTTPVSKLAVSGLPTSAPDASGNAGVVCVTNDGNFWLDNDGTADCT
jgi:hypothetical protein